MFGDTKLAHNKVSGIFLVILYNKYFSDVLPAVLKL